MKYAEINFDGLVGPTHNYAGLSYGNLASTRNRDAVSNPKAAALQGLLKARTLADWGFPQAILPPQERPDTRMLRQWGFSGASEADALRSASREAPELFAAACSASSMWTANAATMAPSCDTTDRRAHFTTANLTANLHRSIEAAFTCRLFRTLFADDLLFAIHPPLEGGSALADEGAANHTRLCPSQESRGLHVFVYGKTSIGDDSPARHRYPARQSLEASRTVARLNHLAPEQTVFVRQSPEAINAGVFHNDVIAVGHRDLLVYHEQAFAEGDRDVERIAGAFQKVSGRQLRTVKVSADRVSLEVAVQSYLFNSQLLTLKDGGVLIAAPSECLASGPVADLLSDWVDDRSNPVREVVSFNLRESMRNGGGPACLRLRMVLSERERQHIRGRIFLDQGLYEELVGWVGRHYRDELRPADLADPQLLEESRRSLDELTRILHLPAIYPFQM